jgi:Sensors of blue-light using FAD
VITYRLIYVSRVGRQVRFADAEKIAQKAADRNAARGVCGLLVYTPSHFLQVLEGQRDDVNATFARIQSDPRHDQIRVLADQPIAAAEFGAWSMVARQMSGRDCPRFEELSAQSALQILRRVQAE